MIKLREYNRLDAESNQKYANNRNVSNYLLGSFPHPYTMSDSTWWTSVGYKEIPGIHKVIDLEGECIGSIGITPGNNEYQYSWELGYWLGEPFWGQGYGTQAVMLMTDFAFNKTNAKRLFATVLAPNVGSRKVLEACGYELEGNLKSHAYMESISEFVDEYLYAKISP